MSDNPNTKKPSEQPALGVEDWELAFAFVCYVIMNNMRSLRWGGGLMMMVGM